MTHLADAARIPIIDLSLFDAGDPWRDSVAAQIDWAAAELGFFYVVGHGIDLSLIESLVETSRAFFAQDEETKHRVHMSRGGRAWRGYFPVGGELTSGRPDLKEGLYFGEELSEDDERVRAGTPLHGRNVFPELPGFREAVLEYMSSVTGLGHRLMAMIGRGLRIGDNWFVDRYTGNPTTLFRIFNYPPARATDTTDTVGVGEHTDYGLLTILYQDEIGGLQVKHGDTWLDVPYVPGSFVCNVGDMLEYLTNGRYTSAAHRVINRSGRARISMPFFFDPRFDAELKDLQGTYGDYLVGKVSKVFPELGRQHLSR